MPYIEVFVDSEDVFEEMTNAELLAELAKRNAMPKAPEIAPGGITDEQLLEQVWCEMRGTPASPALREYIWRVLGRVL